MATDVEAMLARYHRLVLESTIEQIETSVEADPSLTVERVLENLRRDLAAHEEPTLESRTLDECAHCGRPLGHGPDNDLYHLRPDGLLSNRGCRAASYDWRRGGESGWDESLARTLYAKRPKTPRR